MGRTVILTSSFPLFEGDFRGNFVLNYAKQCGGEVVVIAPHAPGAPLREQIGKITVYRLPYHIREDLFYQSGIPEILKSDPLKTLKAIPFLGGLTTFLLIFLKKDDLLISHWLFPTAFIGASIAAIKRCRHRVVVHSGGITLMKRLKLGFFARWIDTHTESFQFVNQIHQRWFEGLTGRSIEGKVLLQPMPVAVDGAPESGYFNPDRIMYIGRLEPIKGVERMLQQIEEISITPTIAGDGSLKRVLSHRFPGANFIGAVSGEEKTELYRKHSIQIVPSCREGIRMEGFPTVILEGLHYGNLLLISRDIQGIDYLLRDQREVCFYNPDHPEALLRLLKEVRSAPEYYHQIALRGQKQVESLILSRG